jgi:acetolactate synthase-1/2/3 large subunit
LKVAHPERTIVGCGDGCYSLSGFELMTAVENENPVIWVIFDDDIFDDEEFKLIKIYQLATYGESGPVEFQNPDFASYARAVPHYSPSPEGVTAGLVETVEASSRGR